MAKENPYLLIVNPETGEEYAVTEEGFVLAEHEAAGFRVDRYQDGRVYEGPLPKVTAAQRERLGLIPPTPASKTVAGAEAAAAAREARRTERAKQEPEVNLPAPEPAPGR